MHHNSIKVKCAWCESEFQTVSRSQLGAFNIGNNVYCSKRCRAAFDRRRSDNRHLLGPCANPNCGIMFRSRRKDKKFCSLKCYLSSDQVDQHLKDINPGLKPEVRLPVTNCLQCGIEIKNKHAIKKFCSKTCQRQHYAERFDRWIANPETLALPQNYDEFLMQEELPCLVDGCNWVGKHLSRHCNLVHGITAEKFKELAGFNKSTGLVTADISKQLSDRMRHQIAEGITLPGIAQEGLQGGRRNTGPPSLEAKEHMTKSQAIIAATAPSKPDVPCPICGEPVKQRHNGRQVYCSVKCRAVEYSRRGHEELKCDYCGSKFDGNRYQVLRSQRGQKVCCSDNCRNQMNMIACLIASGKSLPKDAKHGDLQ